jgi:hypothetical protein
MAATWTAASAAGPTGVTAWAIGAATVGRLADGEVRQLAGGWLLPLVAWQLRADERPPDGTLFLNALFAVGRFRCLRLCRCGWWFGFRGVVVWEVELACDARLVGRRRRRRWRGRPGRGLGLAVDIFVAWRAGAGALRQASRALQAIEHLRKERRRRLLAALGRDPRLFVLVLRVAGNAARLFDLVVDHRDDGVIGYAALARTVVVQHVTRPEPALLHALPRRPFRSLEGREAELCARLKTVRRRWLGV